MTRRIRRGLQSTLMLLRWLREYRPRCAACGSTTIQWVRREPESSA
jgi:hypothetical protein